MNRSCQTCVHQLKSSEEDPCWACEILRNGSRSQWEPQKPIIKIHNGFNSKGKDIKDGRKSRKQ